MNIINLKQIVVIAIFISALTACNQQDEALAVAPQIGPTTTKIANDSTQERVLNGAELSINEISEPDESLSKKYIALSHFLQIETSSLTMQASFDAAIAHCEALNCQLLTANYNRETPYSPPSANLSLRVPPRNVAVFLTGLAKNGEINQHGRTSADKTNQVVDADARILNLTHLRDRLRLMLSDKTAKFKDLIEVERELANTQSELDSFTSTRKLLALETDFVAVNIDFVATLGITDQGFFAPIKQALKNAGGVMMQSFGAVITFLMFVIPWLLIGLPLVWSITWLIKRYFNRNKAFNSGRNAL